MHSNRLACLKGGVCRNEKNIKLNPEQKYIFAKMDLIQERYLIQGTRNDTVVNYRKMKEKLFAPDITSRMKWGMIKKE